MQRRTFFSTVSGCLLSAVGLHRFRRRPEPPGIPLSGTALHHLSETGDDRRVSGSWIVFSPRSVEWAERRFGPLTKDS